MSSTNTNTVNRWLIAIMGTVIQISLDDSSTISHLNAVPQGGI